MQGMAHEQENLVQLEQLEQLVERCLEKRMAQLAPPPKVEQSTNVEVELKHQRELMQQGFEAMDKRFEAMDKRFEAVDKHVNALK